MAGLICAGFTFAAVVAVIAARRSRFDADRAQYRRFARTLGMIAVCAPAVLIYFMTGRFTWMYVASGVVLGLMELGLFHSRWMNTWRGGEQVLMAALEVAEAGVGTARGAVRVGAAQPKNHRPGRSGHADLSRPAAR